MQASAPIPSRVFRALVATLAMVAAGLSAYLAYAGFTGDSVAGCGGGGLFDCGHVIGTRWGRWLGLPVGLFGALLYTMLAGAAMAAHRAVAWRLLMGLVTVAAAGGFWFLIVQAIVLERFCLLCVAVHAMGLVAAALTFAAARGLAARGGQPLRGWGRAGGGLALLAGGAVLLLGAGQAARLDALGASRPSVKGRAILDGRVSVDPTRLPTVGPTGAELMIVELFDYTCPHCRRLSKQLQQARRGLDQPLSVVAMPVPLNAGCNAAVEETNPRHENACALARLALAVWRADPEAFSAYHHWLFASGSARGPETARERARQVVGAEALERALASGWPEKQLGRNVKLYQRLEAGRIPKMIVGDQLFAGTPPSAEALTRILREVAGGPATRPRTRPSREPPVQ